MEKLIFKIVISAPAKKVWETMLNDSTYREWTKAFHPGSYYEGNWQQGSNIRFLGPMENGNLSGMYSRIKESRPYEFLSIRHLGEIVNGIEKPWPESSDKSFALENYSFRKVEDGTELKIELDSPLEYKEMFDDMWPKALVRLKKLSEDIRLETLD